MGSRATGMQLRLGCARLRALVGTDGKRYRRDSVRGDNGLLVMFICNHCPYVKAVLDKLGARRRRASPAMASAAWRSAATTRPTIRRTRSTT